MEKSYHQSFQQLFSDNKFEERIVLLKNASMTPADDQYWKCLAETLVFGCEFVSASTAMQNIRSMETVSGSEYLSMLAMVLYLEGQTLFDQGYPIKALLYFARARELFPNEDEFHKRLISCMEYLNSHESCLKAISGSLERYSNDVDLFLARARLQLLFFNIPNSFADMKQVLKIDPENICAKEMKKNLDDDAEVLRFSALEKACSYNLIESLRKISFAIKLQPESMENLIIKSVLHRKRGDFNAAIDSLKTVFMTCSKNSHKSLYTIAHHQFVLILNDLAVFCFRRGLYNEGRLLLEKAISKEKDIGSLYLNRGDCFMKLGEEHFALLDYKQASEINTSKEFASRRLASLYFIFGERKYIQKEYQIAEHYFSAAIHEYPCYKYFVAKARARYSQSYALDFI